jgi:hypothetical protein
MGGRAMKKQVGALLRHPDYRHCLEAIGRIPARQVVNSLFSHLYHLEASIKWRAVSAMGAVVACLAEVDPESARVVMRRFIWNLNDESGGIGWGSPEAMGDTMARSGQLADEYAHILVSYIQPAGNYLEHPELQKGLLWSLGRLAYKRPNHAREAASHLLPFLESDDAEHRGLAAWTAGAMMTAGLHAAVIRLEHDPAQFVLYEDGRFIETTVGEMVHEVLQSFKNVDITDRPGG